MGSFDNVDRQMPILVVDDFSTMRRVMKSCLNSLGFENITEAEDGAEALDKLRTGSFCFVISDWNMPNLMGLDLLKAVRSDENLKALPFLIVGAEAQKENMVEAAKAGVSSFILKPFTPEILQKKMETIFT